jgi:uncharacterized protein YjbI with pentapeptide repeats
MSIADFVELIKKVLVEANPQGANLQGAYLQGADLQGAYLQGANLQGANLQGANLQGAYLQGANLQGAYLREADLRGANLRGADLRGAYLREADLREADLRGTNLRGADLQEAENLDTVIHNENTAFFALQCPEEGSFIGWKKAKDGAIVKLLIPEDAKRSSATTRKCRCSHAQVLGIWDSEGKELQEMETAYNESELIYKVGEIVKCEQSFEEDRWVECGSGIHFFITKREAQLYN